MAIVMVTYGCHGGDFTVLVVQHCAAMHHQQTLWQGCACKVLVLVPVGSGVIHVLSNMSHVTCINKSCDWCYLINTAI